MIDRKENNGLMATVETHCRRLLDLRPHHLSSRSTMPRLVPSTPSFASPSRELAPYGGGSSPDTSTSVRLCCSGPNGRAVHSLALRKSAAYIETHSLPLLGTVEIGNNDVYDGAIPAVVRTRLPERVRNALERYPPLELLCVDVDSPEASVNKTGDLQKFIYEKGCLRA
jgi:hypothetical protein